MQAIRWILRRRVEVIALWLAAALITAPGLLRLENDNSPEAFFVRDARALEQYRRFTDTFGNLRGMRLVLSGPGLWTPQGLSWLSDVEAKCPMLRGVVYAAGLYGHHQGALRGWPPGDPISFRAQVLADSLDRNAGWVSGDGNTVTLLLALRRMSTGERRGLLQSLERLGDDAPPGVELTLAGLPVVNQALDDAIIEFAVRFFPLLALVTIALMFLALRSAGAVGRTFLLVVICQTIALGLMGYAGASMNIVVMVLIPLVFVLALATAIHLLLTFRRLRQRGRSHDEAVQEAYREKGWPVFWTAVTTWVGFGSLSVSPVPPVRALGLWLAVGIAVMTVAMFTLYPALLAGMRRSTLQPLERKSASLGRLIATRAAQKRWVIVVLFTIAGIGWITGFGRLRIETDVLAYFRPDHPVRATVEDLESRGIGPAVAELFLSTRDEEKPIVERSSPREVEGLNRLAELTERLRAAPRVLGAVSAADLATEIESRQSTDADSVDRFLRTALSMLVSKDGADARIVLQIPMADYSHLEPTFQLAEGLASELFPATATWVTGRYPLVLAAQRTLLRTMILSLSLTFACVAVIFALILGDLRLTLLALVPNLWPVAFVLGSMGWLGIEIDSSTVAIAAVVLGLAVDDTLHFLGRFRILTRSLSPTQAVAGTLESTAGAHILTTVVLAAGFGACGLSSFVPVGRFGVLVAAALAAALVADLLLLPALLAGLEGRALAGLSAAEREGRRR